MDEMILCAISGGLLIFASILCGIYAHRQRKEKQRALEDDMGCYESRPDDSERRDSNG